MSHIVIEREIGQRILRLETGKWARQADASVFATYGETSVLAAVVRAKPREGLDFLPLQVDYRERTSAAGKFPGGFRKREGAPNTKETLTMRMIDRPLRPLFPDGLRDEVLVQCWVESADGQNDPDVLAGTAAAAAMALSSLPFNGPLATVRVGRMDGQFIINPTQAQMDYSDLDLVLSGHNDGVNMIEIGSQELPEDVIAQAIRFGHDQIKIILGMIEELVAKVGKPKTAKLEAVEPQLLQTVLKQIGKAMEDAKRTEGKLAREKAVADLYDRCQDELAPMPKPADPVGYIQVLAIQKKRAQIKAACEKAEEAVVRKAILAGRRSDGRKPEEIRTLTCELAVLPRAHGSAVFTRGETQSMVSCTLGTGRDEQIVDGLGEEYSQKFFLHYNFPPFSVGEVRRVTGPGRREIGHGALAERSLAAILPDPEEFPYTVRLISEILESNGSSSMASVCGGCLALMDAGVPIRATCAGISIGLVQDGKEQVLLTDILGEEDHFGDMDFKVSGTRKGITGIQLDLKTRGLGHELIPLILERARTARLLIIQALEKALPAPRTALSPHAPRLLKTKIHPERIGLLIGPGGKTIRAIQAATGATIDVEEDGTVLIAATGQGKAEAALAEVERLCEEVKEGKVYTGKVVSIKDFGAFIEVTPGRDGLCHISELAEGYLEKVADAVKLGQIVKVKVLAIDEQGRLRLSRNGVIKEYAQLAN